MARNFITRQDAAPAAQYFISLYATTSILVSQILKKNSQGLEFM